MAIDMITYEFLKNYVEGSVMGDNATPRGIWTDEPTEPYAKGHYVTHNNAIYIWYNEETSTIKENPEPGTGSGWEECWQEIIKAITKIEDLGTDNSLIGIDTFATGYKNTAGTMSFKITNFDISNKTLTVEDNATQLEPITTEAGEVQKKTISFQIGNNYDLYCTVESVAYNSQNNTSTITVSNLPSNLNANKLTGALWVPSEPDVGVTAIGSAACAEGYQNKAAMIGAHAEGYYNIAAGKYSHVEGQNNIAVYAAHAEGSSNKALGQQAHAEGNETTASGANSHAEGRLTEASGANSHAEGNGSIADADKSHAEGNGSKAHAQGSHAEGYGTETSSENWSDRGQHVEGRYNVPVSGMAHIVGGGTGDTDRKNIYTLDWNGNAQFTGTVTANGKKLASLDDIPTSLKFTTEYEQLPASGIENLIYLIPIGDSYEEWIWVNQKWELIGSTKIDLTEYLLKTDAVGKKTASNGELFNTAKEASGANSHAENYNTSAIGANSHAEGANTVAEGQKSHAEGEATKTYVQNSHAEGHGTETSSADQGWADRGQHVQGRFNTPISGMAHIVGNGTNNDNRSNAHTLDWNGNAWFAGNVRIGGENYNKGNLLLPIEIISKHAKYGSLDFDYGSGKYDSLRFFHYIPSNSAGELAETHPAPFGEALIYSVKAYSNTMQIKPIYYQIAIELSTGIIYYRQNYIEVDKKIVYDKWSTKNNILTSPSGFKFRLTVDDNGNLIPEKLS